MIFKHQDMVIQTDHIIALRTEHPLANGKHVVALYTAYGKPLQLTMTAAERDELVAAMLGYCGGTEAELAGLVDGGLG